MILWSLLFHSFAVKLTEKGDLSHLENLVKKNPEVLTERDENGATPLHHAAAGGCITLIRFITAVLDPEGRLGSFAEIQLALTRNPNFGATRRFAPSSTVRRIAFHHHLGCLDARLSGLSSQGWTAVMIRATFPSTTLWRRTSRRAAGLCWTLELTPTSSTRRSWPRCTWLLASSTMIWLRWECLGGTKQKHQDV